MRTIIAGSRTVTDPQELIKALQQIDWVPTVVLCGMALGADKLGEKWAEAHNISIEYYPAEWTVYGKKAGPIRNQRMVDHAEALLALWDGQSRGTKNVINLATKKGLKIFIWDVKNI
jgi:hypothetical protein